VISEQPTYQKISDTLNGVAYNINNNHILPGKIFKFYRSVHKNIRII